MIDVRRGEIGPCARIRPFEIADAKLDIGFARKPLTQGRIAPEIKSDDDFRICRHRSLTIAGETIHIIPAKPLSDGACYMD